MLNVMRENATSWIIKLLLALIVLVFIFLGVGTVDSQRPNNIAEINGHSISYDAYDASYRNLVARYQQQFGNQMNEDLMRMLNVKQQALDTVIEQSLMMNAAGEYGLTVTDAELAKSIVDIPVFQVNGSFDESRYLTVLAQNRYSVDTFEAEQRERLLLQKLQALISGTPKVTDQEAKAWYRWDQATIDLEYLEFTPASFDTAEVTGEQVKAYFDKNQDAYKTEPKSKIKYIAINMDDYKDKVTVPEGDVEAYYNDNPGQWSVPKTVEAKHILIKVDQNADDATVATAKEKIEGVLKEIKDGADFAEMAKKHSEGPSGPNGGDLGEFRKETMVKPFADKAFEMAAGEVSDPVRTQFGWHLIKVEKINEANSKTLDDVKDEIEKTLVSELYKNLAHETADLVFDATLKGDDLTQAAAAAKIDIKESDWFTLSTPAIDIADPSVVADAAFKLDVDGISEIVESGNMLYIVECVDRQNSEVPPIEAVEDKVRADALTEEKDRLAKEAADEFLTALKAAEDAEALISEKKVEMKQLEKLRRSATIPGIGLKQDINDALFDLKADSPYPSEVFKGSSSYFVFKFKGVTYPDDAAFEENKTQTINTLKQKKSGEFFADWLKKLRENAEIKIDSSWSDQV